MIKKKTEPEYTEYKPKHSICEHRDGLYCMASKVQNPLIPCEYADYTAHSYYPPCSKKEKEY